MAIFSKCRTSSQSNHLVHIMISSKKKGKKKNNNYLLHLVEQDNLKTIKLVLTDTISYHIVYTKGENGIN